MGAMKIVTTTATGQQQQHHHYHNHHAAMDETPVAKKPTAREATTTRKPSTKQDSANKHSRVVAMQNVVRTKPVDFKMNMLKGVISTSLYSRDGKEGMGQKSSSRTKWEEQVLCLLLNENGEADSWNGEEYHVNGIMKKQQQQDISDSSSVSSSASNSSSNKNNDNLLPHWYESRQALVELELDGVDVHVDVDANDSEDDEEDEV